MTMTTAKTRTIMMPVRSTMQKQRRSRFSNRFITFCLICAVSFMVTTTTTTTTTIPFVMANDTDQTCDASDGPGCGSDSSKGNDPNCVDKDSGCLEAAQSGACDKTHERYSYMKTNCPRSCEVCNTTAPLHLRDKNCKDLNPKCPDWAGAGECIANPGYMLSACQMSCRQCVDTDKLRNDGVDEEEIIRIARYVKSNNHGKTQEVGSAPEEFEAIVSWLKMVDHYRLSQVPTLPLQDRVACSNQFEQCSFWASTGECHKNLPFMMTSCTLACMYCGKRRRQYDQCYGTNQQSASTPYVQPRQLLQVYQSLLRFDGVELASREPAVQQDDPWVLKWDGFLSADESDALVKLLQQDSVDWQPSPEFIAEAVKNVIGPVRRTSNSTHLDGTGGNNQKKKSNKQQNPPLLDTIYSRLAKTLRVSRNNLEPLEFVHFGKMDSFGMHQDYSVHNNWMPAGAQVLSVFLCLNDVPSGGAIGFPDLDWLLVPPQRGQLLIWPNVLSTDPSMPNPVMLSEGLPVLEGHKYGAQTFVRMHNYLYANEIGCG